MGASGMVNSLGHLLGGPAIGAIASAFGISIAIGLSSGAGAFLILPVIILTPLVWRPVRTPSEQTARSEKESTPTLSVEPGRDE